MEHEVFESLRQIVHERSGIALKDGKARMVAARIARRLRDLNLETERQYLEFIKKDSDEIVNLLDVISTNVTRFFREQPHFVFLRQTMSRWISQGQKRFRLWSAASSTGQEPYSIGITINELMRERQVRLDYRLLATDISTRVLAQAGAGRYTAQEVEGIGPGLLERYFRKLPTGGYEVVPGLREQVVFKRLNLNAPPFGMRGPLDIVFCCNVMIYFDQDTKRKLLTEIHRLLRPDGFLIVSHTESLTGLSDIYSPVQPSIYAKASANTRRATGHGSSAS